MKNSNAIMIQNLGLAFGGVKALVDLDLTFASDKLSAIIGPNGAGKSSLINCLTGFYKPTSGTILWRNKQLQNLSIRKIFRLGIVRTFQNIELFHWLSATENVLLARQRFLKYGLFHNLFMTPRSRTEEAQQREVAYEILDFVDLWAERKRPAGTLSYGQRKRLELARALAAEPEVLLLDEPVAGMTREEKVSFCDLIESLRGRMAKQVILIEHDVQTVMRLAEEVFVMQSGGLIAKGSPQEIRDDAKVIQSYLGTGAWA